jgi:hypothetical protein
MLIEVDAAELRRALRAVSPAMSPELTRTHLNGVCLNFEGNPATTPSLAVVATDGHWMVRWMLKDSAVTVEKPDAHKSLQIRASDVAAILVALGPKPTGRARLWTKNRGFRYGGQKIKLADSPVTFPPYRTIAPKLGPHRGFSSVAINPELLAKLAKSVKAARTSPGRIVALTFSFHDSPTDPITVTSDSLPEFMAIVMPCRANLVDRIKTPVAPTPAAAPVDAAAQ